MPIDESQLRYHDRNYLKREVVSKSQAKAHQEGEVIPILEKPGYACPTTYVTRQDAVFKQRAKPTSPQRVVGMQSLDQVTLPDLIRSPDPMRAKRDSSIIDQAPKGGDNSSLVGQYASLMAKAAEKGKGGFNIFDSRRATEMVQASHHQRSGATLE